MSQRAAQKAESRSNILRAAASLLREKGLAAMSVERAMAGAGLTVGAFYSHFREKDELLAESFTLALGEIGEQLVAASRGRAGRAALLDVVSYYLSEGHRDRPAQGCPLPAAAASALPGEEKTLRKLLIGGVTTLADRLASIGGSDLAADRALALAALLVGGQILARATRGSALSSRVLAACGEAARALIRQRG